MINISFNCEMHAVHKNWIKINEYCLKKSITSLEYCNFNIHRPSKNRCTSFNRQVPRTYTERTQILPSKIQVQCLKSGKMVTIWSITRATEFNTKLEHPKLQRKILLNEIAANISKFWKKEISERTICRGFLKKQNFTTRIWSWEWLDEIGHKHTEVPPNGGPARVRLIETLSKLLREVFSSAHHFSFPPLLTLSPPFGNSPLPPALTTICHVPPSVWMYRSNNSKP